jgi:SAM-dependent methyltransferase
MYRNTGGRTPHAVKLRAVKNRAPENRGEALSGGAGPGPSGEAGVVAGDPDWVPPGVDSKRANPARVYDYWLGGSHNFLADQDLGRAICAVDPIVRTGAQANRAFLGRAVRFLTAAGIGQFLDIGSGIPTEGNVHEVAQGSDPAARVAYVDIDPVAVAHSKAILAGHENTAIIQADLREPEKILAHQAARQLIDFDQPVGLLLVAVLHFIADAADPWRIVATLRDALAPGSYLVLGQGTNADKPAVAQAFEKVYNRSVSTDIHMRSRTEILRFFDGFDLVDPGLAYVSRWRPGSPDDVPGDPSQFANLVGVARKA